ncbi:hypothetical protein D3C81_839250 [compost metagenome]
MGSIVSNVQCAIEHLVLIGRNGWIVFEAPYLVLCLNQCSQVGRTARGEMLGAKFQSIAQDMHHPLHAFACVALVYVFFVVGACILND